MQETKCDVCQRVIGLTLDTPFRVSAGESTFVERVDVCQACWRTVAPRSGVLTTDRIKELAVLIVDMMREKVAKTKG